MISTAKEGYKSQADNISIESVLYQFKLLREKTPAERFAIAAKMIRWAKIVSLRGVQKARGNLALEHFARSVLQEKWTPERTPTYDKMAGCAWCAQSTRQPSGF